MANLLKGLFSIPFLSIISVPILYWATWNRKPKETHLVFYAHDNFKGPDATSLTVAGGDGSTSNILKFGSIAVVDVLVTEGPDPESKEIGRARGFYTNSQLDGKGLHMVFSVVFTDGEFKGSTLEIQGDDPFGMKEREYSIVGGTGYFRFVRGFGVLTTELLDIDNLKAIIKHDITIRHF